MYHNFCEECGNRKPCQCVKQVINPDWNATTYRSEPEAEIYINNLINYIDAEKIKNGTYKTY